MDFSRKTKILKLKPSDELTEKYPHVLCLYKDPPSGEISLSEFEEVAYNRVQLLRILEQATQMGNKLYSRDWNAAVIGYLKQKGFRRYIRLLESTGSSSTDAEPQIRREDYISHFILRLAFCRSLDLRNWFIARETELFKMRFLNLSNEGIKTFIKANHLDYSPITNKEKELVKSGLCASTLGYSNVQIETTEFYKVPFTEVTDLVRNTSVYLHKGFAYIPTSELVSCILSGFRAHLTEFLTVASKMLPRLDDDRITNLLTMFYESYIGKDYSNPDTKNSNLSVENLHFYAKSFPMCMRYIYDVINTTHHVKHFSRLQFGLFLKGIGLSLEEAIKFWRGEFGKTMDEATFNKKYLYNIKHSFGTKGRMTSYTPYGCKKIISAEPGPGEQHGCPFKLWDGNTLKQKMMEYGVNIENAREVMEIAGKGHYQIACTKYFTYTHGGIESQEIINHPNQYFEESQEIKNSHEHESFPKRKVTMDANTSQHNTTIDDSIFEDDLDLTQVDF